MLFAVSTFIALYNFTQHFPLYVTVAGLLPCVAGLIVVALLWTPDSRSYFSGHGASGHGATA